MTWLDSKLALRVEAADGAVHEEAPPASRGGDRFDPEQAMDALYGWLDRQGEGDRALVAFGHGVVHGGARFVQPASVSDEVPGELEAGAVPGLMQQHGMTVRQVSNLLYEPMPYEPMPRGARARSLRGRIHTYTEGRCAFFTCPTKCPASIRMRTARQSR